MTKSFLVLVFLVSVASCVRERERKTWEWDSQIFTPILLRQNDTSNHVGTIDTLKSGQRFTAKLFRQFKNLPDSNGHDMIKEFKGYFFQILIDQQLNPAYRKSWTNLNSYILTRNDTAFIDIPIDTVMNQAGGDVRWRAGYQHIFFKDNADTTYVIGGTWHLQRSRDSEKPKR